MSSQRNHHSPNVNPQDLQPQLQLVQPNNSGNQNSNIHN